MDDKKWIREIHQGNNEPLGQIAEKYYDDIYRFCCYQTGNPADACDCAQETFIRFIRYVDSYRERNLKGYLLTIAANVCRDYCKKLYRDRELDQAQLARPAGYRGGVPTGGGVVASHKGSVVAQYNTRTVGE